MQQNAFVSIIIPHFNGEAILMRCLKSLAQFTEYPHEIIIVNNASSDDSIEHATAAFPGIRIIESPINLGYAGGCNLGMEAAKGDYFLLLNNDAVVTANWLSQLMAFAAGHAEYGALQPKIQSIDREGWYDYAGAAGGKIDIFGFPFSRGRIFFTIEKDENQYDQTVDLFWASGTCTLLQRRAVEITGMLDVDFFAHMEEIDLDWRMLLAGFKIGFVPGAMIKHNAGSTLAQNSPRKIYLNHRNNLEMLLKNYTAGSLLLIFPLRLLFELVAVFFALMKADFAQAAAILKAGFAIALKLPSIAGKRKMIKKIRKRTDGEIMDFMYKNSIIWQYFIKGKKNYASLNCE